MGEKHFYSVPLRIIASNPALICISLFGTIDLFLYSHKIEKDYNRVFLSILLASEIIAIIVWILVSAQSSEMYFIMTGYVIMIFRFVIQYKCFHPGEEKADSKSFYFYIKKTITACSVIVSVILTLRIFCSLPAEWQRINAIVDDDYSNQVIKEDSEALRWLRDNTPQNVVCISDRILSDSYIRSYYYGLYSERSQYMENDIIVGSQEGVSDAITQRKNVIHNLYEKCDLDSINTLLLENVDYVIQTKRITPYFVPDNRYLEYVGGSDSINIYKILR
jgi:hypothetical protein